MATGISRRALLGGTAAAPFAVRGAARPNVVVFFGDQESALLPGPANLPNRRRIEERAVRFTHAFCNTPQCSAARSSLLTGLEPHRTGVLTNVDGSSLGKPLPASLPNMGSVFRKAGYTTGYFGKWHLGNDRAGLDAYGFSTYQRGKDEVVAGMAAEWIRAQRSPWLAWVSVLNPHDIYAFPKLRKTVQPREGVKPPVSRLDNLAGKPAEQQQYVDKDQGAVASGYTPEDWVRYRSYYLGLVEKVDACLGAVLEAVDLANTVFVFTSDHGDALGEHGLPFKGPFMYEENIRIPLLIAAPGLRKGERNDMVTQADVAPTVASLAGLSWPTAVAGVDLAKRRSGRDGVFLEYYAKQKWVNPIRTFRGRRWKLNWYNSGNQELYDLAADPHETRNLAREAAYEKVRREIEARIERWRPPIS